MASNGPCTRKRSCICICVPKNSLKCDSCYLLLVVVVVVVVVVVNLVCILVFLRGVQMVTELDAGDCKVAGKIKLKKLLFFLINFF